MNNLPNKDYSNSINRNNDKKSHSFSYQNFSPASLMNGGYLKWTKLANSNKWIPLIKIETEKPVVINKNFTRQILNKLDKSVSSNLHTKIANSLTKIILDKKDENNNNIILNQSFSENNLILDNQESKSIFDDCEQKKKIVRENLLIKIFM